MEKSGKKKQRKKKLGEAKTFPVPFTVKNINSTINTPYKPSKEQIINQAIKFHLEGNIQEASKSYQNLINQGLRDHRVFTNYGAILSDLGKLEEAEVSTRKAIEIKPDFANAHSNLGNILSDLGKLQEAESSIRKAIEIKPDYANAYYNLGNLLNDLRKSEEAELSYRRCIQLNPNFHSAHLNLSNILYKLGKLRDAEISYRKTIELYPDCAKAHFNLGQLLNELGRLEEGEKSIIQCLNIDENYLEAKIILSSLKLHQGDNSLLTKLIQSTQSNHPFINSLKWVSALPKIPEVFFQRFDFYDAIIKQSIQNRPFYEFGVYTGSSFKYLIKAFQKGYGFDTFEGLPENWDRFKKGAFSTQGTIPKINGGTFIAGMFEDTLPTFFSRPRPIASVINFDADLYSSTICALNYSQPIIDKDTILIFDEFIVHENWEKDEYRALNEFCSKNNLSYEVLAVSYSTYQTAVKLIGI